MVEFLRGERLEFEAPGEDISREPFLALFFLGGDGDAVDHERRSQTLQHGQGPFRVHQNGTETVVSARCL